jgi:hypothetical protein
MSCIICQDSGSEPLQDNTSCKCKYKRHISCWIDYVHSRDKVICPLCRVDLTTKPIPKTKTSMNSIPTITTPLRLTQQTPYSSQLSSIPEEQGTQITYQEFAQTVQENTIIQVRPSIQPVSQPENPKDLPLCKKIAKVIIGLSIVAIIVLVFVLFVGL